MKKIFISILLLIFISGIGVAQTYKIHQGDTINFKDPNGLKQRKWIIFNSSKRLPGYKPDQKVEEGAYLNSRKQGSVEKILRQRKC